MAATTRRDLFLQVSANIDPLRAASQAGRTVLNELGTSAVATVEEIERAFETMAAGRTQDAAKLLERNFQASFRTIQETARQMTIAPDQGAALAIVNTGAAREAVRAAEDRAASLRMVAAAAQRAATSEGENAVALRAYATAAAAAVVAEEQNVEQLRAQALALEQVERELASSGARMSQSTEVSGRFRAGMQQLSFNINDVVTGLATSQPVMMIFAQQGSQIVQAIQLMNNQTEGFLGFLSGPYGQLMTAATLATVIFGAELLKSANAIENEVDKLKKDAVETENTRRAKELFRRTTEGLTQAIREQQEQLDKSIASTRNAADAAYELARANLAAAKAKQAETEQELINARAKLEIDKQRSQQTGPRGDVAALGADASQQRVLQLEQQLSTLQSAVDTANSNLEKAQTQVADEASKRLADPMERIRARYERLRREATAQALADHKTGDDLAKRLAALRTQEQNAIEAEQRKQAQAKSAQSQNRQFGRDNVSVDEARRIVEGIGGRVTSGTRSYAEQKRLYDQWVAEGRPADNPVAKPGTSAHERSNALDIAMGKGISIASIRKAFEDEGIKLTKAIVERGHYHVEWGKRGPSQETVERREDAAEQKRRNAEAEYGNMLARALEERTRLERDRVLTAAEAAQLDMDSVNIERERQRAAAQKGVADKKWTQAQADALASIYDQNAELRVQAIVRRKISAQLDEQLQALQVRSGGRLDMLNLQLAAAASQRDRRDIARQILDEQTRVALARQDRVINDPTSTTQQVENARAESANINGAYGLRRAEINRQYADPMDQYRERLRAAVGDTDEALKQVQANGLQSLEDGLLGIISGTETVAGAFKKMATSIIADLARIAIEKMILSAIGMPTFSTGGAPAPIPGFADGGIPGFAAGGTRGASGLLSGPGTGTSDSILAIVAGRGLIRVSNGESIVNAEATRRHWPLIQALNEGRIPGFAAGGLPDPATIAYPRLPTLGELRMPGAGGGAPQVFDLRGAVVTEQLLEQINARIAQGTALAVMAGSAHAQQELADRSYQRIP